MPRTRPLPSNLLPARSTHGHHQRRVQVLSRLQLHVSGSVGNALVTHPPGQCTLHSNTSTSTSTLARTCQDPGYSISLISHANGAGARYNVDVACCRRPQHSQERAAGLLITSHDIRPLLGEWLHALRPCEAGPRRSLVSACGCMRPAKPCSFDLRASCDFSISNTLTQRRRSRLSCYAPHDVA